MMTVTKEYDSSLITASEEDIDAASSNDVELR